MSLKLQGYIDLPENKKAGGFDHAAVHRASAQVFVAHTSNDAVDVIDCASGRYLRSIPDLTGVAGALVSDERNLIFTSNRGEDSISIIPHADEKNAVKVGVGVRPNGLSFDAKHGLLLAANVGNPDIPGSFTLSIVDVAQRKMVSSISVPGRTRWTIYDEKAELFYVNIGNPAQIVIVDANKPTVVAKAFTIPAEGPHGLDFDADGGRLFCACDGAQLVTVNSTSGKILDQIGIGGAPDVIFFNKSLGHLYIAIGDPGVIEVVDTKSMKLVDKAPTEKGAHTIAFDADRNSVYAFLPETHRAAVYLDP